MRIMSTKQWLKAEFAQRPDLLPSGTAVADKVLTRLTATWNQSRTGAASEAERYRALLQVADSEIDNMTARAGELPCRLGCNYCCKDERIALTEKEAVLVVQHIEQRLDPAERARVLESIASSEATTDQASVPCAMLIDERCAVYASRPLCCRSYFSRTVESCHTFFVDKTKMPQRFSAPKMVELAVREVTRAARHSRLYEINALLKRLYADPKKPGQWAVQQLSDETDLADPE